MKQPKDKAEELKTKFGDLAPDVVDEIMKENHEIDKKADIPQELVRLLIKRLNFWQAVKKELV